MGYPEKGMLILNGSPALALMSLVGNMSLLILGATGEEEIIFYNTNNINMCTCNQLIHTFHSKRLKVIFTILMIISQYIIDIDKSTSILYLKCVCQGIY